MAKLLKQYGALPVTEVSGPLHMLLITLCVTHRGIIPKGHPEEKMRPGAEAVLKALEGAGVSGGRYRARKCLASGKLAPWEVNSGCHWSFSALLDRVEQFVEPRWQRGSCFLVRH